MLFMKQMFISLCVCVCTRINNNAEEEKKDASCSKNIAPRESLFPVQDYKDGRKD